MNFGFRRAADGPQCSFCHKSEKDVGKLVSSPSDYSRAYICDECIRVCASIEEMPDPIIGNPLLSEFLGATQDWLAAESAGQNVTEHLSRMRSIASSMFAPASPRVGENDVS